MRNSIKVIALTLAMSNMLSTTNASAEAGASSSTDWPLGMSIAMQGDNALLSIQSSALSSISQSIHQQMGEALPAQHARKSAADSGQMANDAELAFLLASQ